MRSEDEEDEDEYEDNEEHDEDEVDLTQLDAEAEADDAEPDGDGEDEEAGDGDGDADEDDEADGDEEDDEEDGEEADGDGDGEGEGDEDEEDDGDDGDGDGDEEEDDEGEDEEGDAETVQPEHPSSPIPSHPSVAGSKRSPSPSLPLHVPVPPYKLRRSLLLPSFASAHTPYPRTLTIDAIVAIPTPAPVHCLASTACASYLLTGSQEGVVRTYDFYGSVNGAQLMTAQQRANVGMGETISKVGVGRGWWVSDAEIAPGATPMGGQAGAGAGERRTEPVYSLAVEGDGLWALTGTQVSMRLPQSFTRNEEE